MMLKQFCVYCVVSMTAVPVTSCEELNRPDHQTRVKVSLELICSSRADVGSRLFAIHRLCGACAPKYKLHIIPITNPHLSLTAFSFSLPPFEPDGHPDAYSSFHPERGPHFAFLLLYSHEVYFVCTGGWPALCKLVPLCKLNNSTLL